MTKTIMVVEDDEPLRYAMAHGLRNAGFAVIEAQDSMASLREFSAGTPIDLMICDVKMPDGAPHGFALARMARMQYRELPIIFITGYRDLVERETAVDSIGSPIFYKPLDIPAIIAAVGARLAA